MRRESIEVLRKHVVVFLESVLRVGEIDMNTGTNFVVLFLVVLHHH